MALKPHAQRDKPGDISLIITRCHWKLCDCNLTCHCVLFHRLDLDTRIELEKLNRDVSAKERKDSIAAMKKEMVLRRKVLNPRSKKKLARFAELPRGSHIALTTKFKGIVMIQRPFSPVIVSPLLFFADKPLLCCAWADKTLKTAIGTSGWTLPGTPIKRTTYKALPQVSGPPLQDIRHRYTHHHRA